MICLREQSVPLSPHCILLLLVRHLLRHRSNPHIHSSNIPEITPTTIDVSPWSLLSLSFESEFLCVPNTNHKFSDTPIKSLQTPWKFLYIIVGYSIEHERLYILSVAFPPLSMLKIMIYMSWTSNNIDDSHPTKMHWMMNDVLLVIVRPWKRRWHHHTIPLKGICLSWKVYDSIHGIFEIL